MAETLWHNCLFSNFFQVIFLEWWEHEKLVWLKDFLESKGYQFVMNRPGDIIFVRKNSEAADMVTEKQLWSDFIQIYSN